VSKKYTDGEMPARDLPSAPDRFDFGMMKFPDSIDRRIVIRTTKFALSALTAAALVAAAPSTATAAPGAAAPTPKPVTTAVTQPFNLALHGNRLLVADGGNATVSRVLGNGTLRTVAVGPTGKGDVAGVAISHDGRYIAYTSTEHPSEEVNANGRLVILGPKGSKRIVDLAAYEAKRNPDKVNTYGAVGTINDKCRAQIEAASHLPASYGGQKDSHPYSVTAYGKNWIVADAGGNALLKVSRRGHVSTLAVLPVQPVKITTELAGELEAPDCVGITYRFEPVPTDVEIGKRGRIYATTLPGGAGAPGSVYRISHRGHSRQIATGFAGATNLALWHGKIFVSEFFSGQISVVKNGAPKLYLKLPGVVSVESAKGRKSLYAGVFGQGGPGSVVKIKK